MASREVVIKKLLTHISGQQLTSGWFKSVSIHNQKQKPLSTPYFSLLIASVLNDKNLIYVTTCPQLRTALSKLQHRIARERSEEGTYNYWFHGSKNAISRHIPDDWDDTALAYVSLLDSAHVKAPFAYTALKKSRPTKTGFFETWILEGHYPEKWQDQDVWVNLNILFWLSRENVFLPDIWNLCLEKISTETSTSKYYIEEYSLLFFFTRTAIRLVKHTDEKTKGLLKNLQAKLEITIKDRQRSILERAWMLATLQLLKSPDCPKFATSLANEFIKVGMEAEPVILGWQQPGKTVYDGCSALTATLILTGLQEVNLKILHTPKLETQKPGVRSLLTHLLKSDFTQEIINLPWEVSDLMEQPASEHYSQQAEANLLGWGYYWLDDLEIDHHDTPFRIQTSKEEVYRLYKRVHQKLFPENHVFWKNWNQTISSYTQAANRERSFHYSLEKIPRQWDSFYLKKCGPYTLAVRASGGSSYLVKVYEQYLLAKQYSDDARDCLEDFRAGRRTLCTQLMYEGLAIPTKEYSDLEIKKLFLEFSADIISHKIHTAINRSEFLAVNFGERWYRSSLFTRLMQIRDDTVRHERHRREVTVIQAATRSRGNS
jgi:hypothetical protein